MEIKRNNVEKNSLDICVSENQVEIISSDNHYIIWVTIWLKNFERKSLGIFHWVKNSLGKKYGKIILSVKY